MEPLTAEEIALIDSARDVAQGLCFTGMVATKRDDTNTHYVKLDYIRAKLGYRAIGGFFDPTRRNVTRKFAAAWLSAHK